MKHATGTRQEWLGARLELLKAEKELVRQSDALAVERQKLPWVRIEKTYRFETEDGSATLKDLFKGWLEHHYPLKAAHVMSRVRQLRGGKENDPNFGTRLRGTGLLADLLSKRFENACRRLGLNQARRSPDVDTSRFRPPRAGSQLDLF